jgi:hypothetical protein
MQHAPEEKLVSVKGDQQQNIIIRSVPLRRCTCRADACWDSVLFGCGGL